MVTFYNKLTENDRLTEDENSNEEQRLPCYFERELNACFCKGTDQG